MNTLIIIWLAINAMIGLPILGFAICCKIQDLRSKQSPAGALEFKEAA